MPRLTRSDKQMLSGLNSKLITDLTADLNKEAKKLDDIDMSAEEKNKVVTNCDKILAKIKNRLEQWKKVSK